MNPRIWFVAGASAVVASSGVVVAAMGGAAAAPPQQTIHVVELDTHDTYVPVGRLTGSKAQSTQGDFITFDDPLVNPGSTTHIGRIRGTCWLTTPKTGLFFCSVESTFNGKGEIEFTGLYDSTGKTSTITSVTGGTGAYQNATGTAKVKALSQTKNDFVITLG